MRRFILYFTHFFILLPVFCMAQSDDTTINGVPMDMTGNQLDYHAINSNYLYLWGLVIPGDTLGNFPGSIAYIDNQFWFRNTQEWITPTQSAEGVTSITANAPLTGGTIITTGNIGLSTTGTAGTYGDATHIPVITTDAYGRISNTSLASIGGGTVTSISFNSPLTGGTITTSGTVNLDTAKVPLWDDTVQGNRWLITPAYLKSFGYGTGTVTSITNSDGSLIFNNTAGAITGSLNTANAVTWTAAPTVNLTGLGSTNTMGYTIENTTAATSSVQWQNAPGIQFLGNAWQSSANTQTGWRMYMTQGAGNYPIWNFDIFNSVHGGWFNYMSVNGATNVMTIPYTFSCQTMDATNIAVGSSAAHQTTIDINGKINIGGTSGTLSTGTATLSSGTVTVSNSLVTGSSMVWVEYYGSVSGSTSILTVPTKTSGTSFVVTAITPGATTTNTSDNNVIKYWIVN